MSGLLGAGAVRYHAKNLKLGHDLPLKLQQMREQSSETDPAAALAEATLQARPELKELGKVPSPLLCCGLFTGSQKHHLPSACLHLPAPSGASSTAQLCGALQEHTHVHLSAGLLQPPAPAPQSDR